MAEEKHTELGSRIAELRREREWGQRTLAAEAGITQPTVWAIESGKQLEPRLSTLRKIANAFGMTTEELFAPKVRAHPPARDWLDEWAGHAYLTMHTEELLPILAALRTEDDVSNMREDVRDEMAQVQGALARKDLDEELRASLETAMRNSTYLLKDLSRQRRIIREGGVDQHGTRLVAMVP